MRHSAAALLLVLLGSPVLAAEPFPDDAAWIQLEARDVKEFLRRHPVVSTYLGGSGLYPDLARADAKLRDWSPPALEEEAAFYREVRAAAQKLNPAHLLPRRRIDREVALHQIEFMLHQDVDRKYWQRAVDTYVSEAFRGVDWSMQGMTDLGDGHLGTESEWQTVAGRVAALPVYLIHAQSNLKEGLQAGNVPDWRMVQQDGLETSEQNARYFEATLPKIAAERTKGQPFAARVTAQLTENGVAAAAAFREFRAFLQTSLASLPRKDRYALGAKEYDWALANNLDVRDTAESLWERSAAVVQQTREQMMRAAEAVAAGRKVPWNARDREASTRAVFDALAADHPKTDDEMVRWYHDTALRLVEFARQKQMFEIPKDYALEVTVTPPSLESSIDGAAYYSAPPFRDHGVGRFYVTPTHGDVEMLKQNNRAAIADLSAHEGFPGHDWHFKTMTVHRDAISPVRWLTPGEVEGSSSMWEDSMAAEGWALYAESLMAEPQPGAPDGFYTPEERLYQLQGQLYRDLRVRIDTGLHTNRLAFDDAVDLFSTVVDFLPGSCADKAKSPAKKASCDAAWRAIFRYSKWPTQAITYHLGKARILDLRARAETLVPGPAGRKRFHELFMQQGTIPPGFFEAELLAQMKP
jgi:uncharacterized protein (DUF885 family)